MMNKGGLNVRDVRKRVNSVTSSSRNRTQLVLARPNMNTLIQIRAKEQFPPSRREMDTCVYFSVDARQLSPRAHTPVSRRTAGHRSGAQTSLERHLVAEVRHELEPKHNEDQRIA